MDNFDFVSNSGLKPGLDQATKICRCCLSTQRRMVDASTYSRHFMDLAGINILESELPQWVCYECGALLLKAVRFKHKLQKAHSLLYEYSSRCAPFPIHAQDPELSKYASAHLSAANTLCFDNDKSRMGYHRVLEHEKHLYKTDLDVVEFSRLADVVDEQETKFKAELGFSDYEDNITLEEYRSNVTKLTEEDIKVTEDDLAQLLEASEKQEETEKKKKKAKRKEIDAKSKTIKVSDDVTNLLEEPKSSIRKTIEIDPTKIKVVILNPEEQIKQREEESKANLKFPFQCQFCFKGFNFEAKLQNHMSKHRPSRGPFECKLCNMYLPSSYSYSVHTLIHTRRFECLKCGVRMMDKISIMDHYRTKHEGFTDVFTCHICGKVSNNSKTHRGHMRNHHSGERPTCDQCGKSFINKDSLAEHIQIHQGIKNYECGTCGKRFRTRTQIRNHQLKHSDVREYYCVECDTRFKSAQSLRQHLLRSLKHLDKQSLKYPCPHCDKRFNGPSRLSEHVSVQHLAQRPHRCAQCPAALATAASLRKHEATVHRGLKAPPRHVCEACGKAFRGKSVLINHTRTHTGEKPFECAQCGRSFSQRGAMRNHVRVVHLKIRRSAKIKPEAQLEPPPTPKAVEAFLKEETPIVFHSWRQPAPSCDVFFHTTQP